MRVALNALSIANRSGTGRYTWGLLHGFAQLRLPDLRLAIFIPSDYPIPSAWWDVPGFRFYSCSARNTVERIAWEQAILPRLLRRLQPDCLHSPASVAPVVWKPGCRSLVTIHDWAFARYPHTIPSLRRWYYRWAIPRSLAQAHRVLTDSNAMASELVSLGIPPDRIVAAHLGVDTRAFHPEPVPADAGMIKTCGPATPYFLFVGTLEPRKNLSVLIAAYSRARERGLRSDLAVAGRWGWMVESVELRQPGVHLLGHVTDEQLSALYRNAVALAAPSLYEGFDLPVMESLACGTPVIASDIPVHREILGEQGRYVPVQDIEGWAVALLEFSQSGKIPVPKTVSIRDWSDVARETYRVYL